MVNEEMAQLALKGLIAEMPKEDQEKIDECLERMRSLLAEYGRLANFALPLLMFEAAKAMDKP